MERAYKFVSQIESQQCALRKQRLSCIRERRPTRAEVRAQYKRISGSGRQKHVERADKGGNLVAVPVRLRIFKVNCLVYSSPGRGGVVGAVVAEIYTALDDR